MHGGGLELDSRYLIDVRYVLDEFCISQSFPYIFWNLKFEIYYENKCSMLNTKLLCSLGSPI